MNEQQVKYARLKEQELREQDARLAKLEARARQENAEDELAELTGLRNFNAKLRDALARFNQQAGEQLDQVRSDIEQGAADAANDMDRVAERLARIDAAAFEAIASEFDETDAEIREAEAWLAQAVIQFDVDTQAELAEVREQRDQAQESRREAAASSDETRPEKRTAFKRALEDLKSKWSSVREKIRHAHRETQPEQHP